VGLALSGYDPKIMTKLLPIGIRSCKFSRAIGAEIGRNADVFSKDLWRLNAFLLGVHRMNTNEVLGCEHLGTLVTL
jgi:hypothetical protein